MRSNYFLYTFNFRDIDYVQDLQGTKFSGPSFKGTITDEEEYTCASTAYYFKGLGTLYIQGFELNIPLSTALSFKGKQLITMHSREDFYEK